MQPDEAIPVMLSAAYLHLGIEEAWCKISSAFSRDPQTRPQGPWENAVHLVSSCFIPFFDRKSGVEIALSVGTTCGHPGSANQREIKGVGFTPGSSLGFLLLALPTSFDGGLHEKEVPPISDQLLRNFYSSHVGIQGWHSAFLKCGRVIHFLWGLWALLEVSDKSWGTPSHPFVDGIFHCKPSSYWVITPIYGNPHRVI